MLIENQCSRSTPSPNSLSTASTTSTLDWRQTLHPNSIKLSMPLHLVKVYMLAKFHRPTPTRSSTTSSPLEGKIRKWVQKSMESNLIVFNWLTDSFYCPLLPFQQILTSNNKFTWPLLNWIVRRSCLWRPSAYCKYPLGKRLWLTATSLDYLLNCHWIFRMSDQDTDNLFVPRIFWRDRLPSPSFSTEEGFPFMDGADNP